MCRHLGYVGPPVAVGELVVRGPHSLYAQSWAPREMRRGGTINADGFGVAWWRRAEVGIDGAREAATRYRNAAPIWTDPAVAEVLGQLESRSVLAAVRSATVGMPIERAACAPFIDEHWAFSHNGVVPDWRTTLPLVLADLDQILTAPASPSAPRGTDDIDVDQPAEPLHTDPETAASVDSQGADVAAWQEPGSSPTAWSPDRGGPLDQSTPPRDQPTRPAHRNGAPDGVGRVSEGVDQARNEVGQAPDGVDQARNGVGQAPDGVGQARDGVGQAPDRVNQDRINQDRVNQAPDRVGQASDRVAGALTDGGHPPNSPGRQDFPATGAVFGSPAALLRAESLTDSAALWVLLRGLLGAITPDGPVRSPADALRLLVGTVLRYQPTARLNLLLGNGAELWATTCWHSLSVLVADDYTVLSSEPYDDDPRWQPVDDRQLVIAGPGRCAVTALALPTTERVRS